MDNLIAFTQLALDPTVMFTVIVLLILTIVAQGYFDERRRQTPPDDVIPDLKELRATAKGVRPYFKAAVTVGHDGEAVNVRGEPRDLDEFAPPHR